MVVVRVPAGAAELVLVDGVALLHPDEQVFEAMLQGWRKQGLARNLAPVTVQARERQVRAFQTHSGAFPWQWMPQQADDWFADLRAVRHCTRSTVRGYQVAVRGFCAFVTDPAYGVGGGVRGSVSARIRCRSCTEVERRAACPADVESEPRKRRVHPAGVAGVCSTTPMSRSSTSGRAVRKGWLPAFRDATIVEDGVRVRAAAHRDGDAGRGRFRA